MGVPGAAEPDEHHHELIGMIYEADNDPALWRGVLAELCRVLDGERALLACHDLRDGSGRIKYWHNVGPAYRQAYAERCGSENPWLKEPGYTERPGLVFSGQEILPHANLKRTNFCRDFAEPLGMVHTLHARIANSGKRQLHLTVSRGKKRGAFSAKDTELCQAVVTHMRRAQRLEDTRNLQHVAEIGTMEALNRLSIGVLIVDALGTIMAMNEAARTIVESDDGLRRNRLSMEAACQDTNRRLKRVLSKCARYDSGKAQGAMQVLTVNRPSGCRPYSVLICPFQNGVDFWDQPQSGSLVFVIKPEHDVSEFNGEMLQNAYCLTPAEVRVAGQVAQGHKLIDIAKNLMISVHTARTHLKHIFEKTGVERQAELVCLLHDCLWLVRNRHERMQKHDSSAWPSPRDRSGRVAMARSDRADDQGSAFTGKLSS